MVFSSLVFLFIFLPINIIVYYQMPTRTLKNLVLIISSLIFYAWGEPVWIVLLLFSSVVDYFHGLIAEKYQRRWQAKAALVSSLVINLGLLIIFKYSEMFVSTFSSLAGLSIEYKGFSLPIGISFYTFQTISYVFDVYRGEVKAQKSFFKFLMFVSLFHQLVAGPIVRYKDIAYEIEHRVFDLSGFSEGVNRFIIGLAKKVMLANPAGQIGETFLLAQSGSSSVLGSWYGILMFAFQIYFDFSGYSDMAIGLGKMFGFTYLENFNYPYIAESASDFWRRWHISLGSFFRDYLYIPLGGNRRHMIRNLLVVWFLTGLWHGASWNFVVWGLYYGLLITLEKVLDKRAPFRLPKVIKHIYLVVAVLVGWVFFYFPSLNDGVAYLGRMFGMGRFVWSNLNFEIVFMNNVFFMLLALVASTPLLAILWKKIDFGPAVIIRNILLFSLSVIMLVGQSYNPFLYFRF